MQQQDFLMRILRADEGCYLTQADPATPIEMRLIASEVCLTDTDDPAAWVEITAAEAEAYRAEMESQTTNPR